MKQLKTTLVLTLICIIFMSVCSSCNSQKEEIKRVKDLDCTIVEDADIPEELLTIINEKKEAPFKLTFTSKGKEYYYIVVGYGTQNTGGYSISVDDLFLSTNVIYIDTNLIGPSKDEVVTQVFTYPYIVVKTEFIDKKVVFK